MIGPVTLDKHPAYTAEYDAVAQAWFYVLPVDTAQITDADLDCLEDDFGVPYTAYYSRKVLAEARAAGQGVCLVFREQAQDPCAIRPLPKSSAFDRFFAEHNPEMQRLVSAVLANMNNPNP